MSNHKKIIICGISILVLCVGFLYLKYNQYLPTTENDIPFPEPLNQTQIQDIRKHFPITKLEVFKAKRKLNLIASNGDIIRQYPIRLGFDPVGHKVQEGDGKTPEGLYKIDWRNSKSAFYKSLHISYPNEIDQQNAKNLGVSAGGDIMIHGSTSSQQIKTIPSLMTYFPQKDWTFGCIAVRNIDIDEIWQLVDNQTDIFIHP